MITRLRPRPREAALGTHEKADVCLIVEGCYPYVAGGVSSWVDWLMRTQSELTFSVVSVVADDKPRQARYARPPNMLQQYDVVLHEPQSQAAPGKHRHRPDVADPLASALTRLVDEGGLEEFRKVLAM